MANRRMISKKIVFSDDFLGMPVGAQLLYIYLIARADDDGFMNHPKSVMRNIGVTEEEMAAFRGIMLEPAGN